MIKLNFKSNKVKTSILATLTLTSINSFAASENLLRERITPQFSEKKYNVNRISEKSKDKFSISLTLNNNVYILELEDNSKLNKRKKYSKNSFSLLKGKIKNIENSWVRLTEEDGIYTGLLFDGTDTFVIDTVEQFDKITHKINKKNNKLSRQMNNKKVIAMNLEDIEHDGSCAAHSEDSLSDMYSINTMSIDQNLLEENLTESRTIVIDLTGDKEFANGNESTAEQNILSYINTVNGIYESTFNVTFEIGEIKFLDDSNNITSTDSIDILTEFRAMEYPIETVSHIFTGKDMDTNVVGRAYLSSLCNNFSVGVTQKYGALTSVILAHELGHNFSAPHDNQSGSACSFEPSGYIMNPSVSRGLSEFSQCSQDKINTFVESRSCFTVYNEETEITSQPNTYGLVSTPYQYDPDYTVNFKGENVFFELEVAPEGMTISDNGLIEWIPTNNQVGDNPVQILAVGNNGEDRQEFNVYVEEPEIESLYLSEYRFNSFLSQDKSKLYSLNDRNPYEVTLLANTWKYINHEIEVTPNTYLEFTFKSGENKGEIQGIGLHKSGKGLTTDKFNLYGTQNWGKRNFRYNNIGDEQTFKIRLIDFYSEGIYDQLVFINDNDVNSSQDKYSTFSNIKFYEEEVDLPPVSEYILFDEYTLYPLSNQDGQGEVFIVKDGSSTGGISSSYGKEIQLTGNKWQMQYGDYHITPNSVLEFEFASNLEGEIHGIGFTNGQLNKNHTFSVLGTQNWGIKLDKYNIEESNNLIFKKYIVNVGEYFTGDFDYILIYVDNDSNQNSNSNTIIKNVKLR